MRVIVFCGCYARLLCLPALGGRDDVNPDEIIQKFAAKEAGVRRRRATTTPTARA